MSQIKIRANDSVISLPLNSEGHLSLTLLKQYFPRARGLTFTTNEGEVVGLEINDGIIIVDSKNSTESKVYDVHIEEPPSKPLPGNERKRQMVQELLSKISNKEKGESLNVKNDPQKNKTNSKKKSVPRVIHIGWLRKMSSSSDKYAQVKKPLGGIKELSLMSSTHYSADEIKDKAVELFMDETNRRIFNDSEVNLGLFDGTVLQSFTDSDGQQCDIWGYCYSRKIIPCKLTLYLLSAPKSTPCKEKSQAPSAYNPSIGSSNRDTAQNSIHEVETPVVQETAVKESEDNECLVIVSGEFNSAIIKNAATGPIVENDTEILYHDIKQSKYTGDFSITERNKNDLYLLALSGMVEISFEEFEPQDFGYKISKIEHRTRELLQIDVDNISLKKNYNFPSSSWPSSEDIHKLLYDVDVLYGRCCEQWGVGVIPTCTDACKPIFSWYRDGKLLKKGSFLYWLPLDAASLESAHIYKCIIMCHRQKLEPNEDLRETKRYGEFQGISMPVIQRNDFTLSREILGAGAQGTVRKGYWLGTSVAIKTMKVSMTNAKFTARELRILEQVRHPSIIQVMGVCIELQQLHIVMELFISHPLSDILFDQEINNEYALSEATKHCIARQMCQAVNYLHEQKNPIIHRDIKPSNVLVSKDLRVKLCDLSLSKFTQAATALRTTSGTNTSKGTPLYMAPEMFLKQENATVNSDIWSLGCSLVELYTEQCVWILDSDEAKSLKEKLIAREVPNLTSIPLIVRPIIEKCFKYDVESRPLASMILEALPLSVEFPFAA